MMIQRFLKGPAKVFCLIITTPSLLAIAITLAALVVLAIVFPGSVYIHRFWNGQPKPVALHPLGSCATNVDVTVVTPDRIVVGGKDLVLTIETRNIGPANAGDARLTLAVNENHPFARFVGKDVLPIIIEQRVPAGKTLIETLPFELMGGAEGSAPVVFTIEGRFESFSCISSFPIPVDYWSIPIAALMGGVVVLAGVIAAIVKAIRSG